MGVGHFPDKTWKALESRDSRAFLCFFISQDWYWFCWIEGLLLDQELPIKQSSGVTANTNILMSQPDNFATPDNKK
jgi:hypothetical protein